MDKVERYLQQILDSLHHEGCLIKKGQILHENDLFAQNVDRGEILDFVQSAEIDVHDRIYRSNGTFYSAINPAR